MEQVTSKGTRLCSVYCWIPGTESHGRWEDAVCSPTRATEAAEGAGESGQPAEAKAIQPALESAEGEE